MAEGKQINNIGWNFHNTYKDLPKPFYSEINLSPVRKPELVILNKPLAKSLNLNVEALESKEGVEILSGNKKAEGGACISQAYSGHQFGHFTMLGDGRAVLIGEQTVDTPIHITGEGYKKFDIQLKGSGRTPYSRGGDGRAVLGPMLREYIISEAMYNLKIPTTRSLAVVKTGEKVYREYVKEGAILTRVASSHLRFGTFEYAANYLGKEEVKKLADYAIETHYPYVRNDENKYLSFLKEVIKAHASLVSKWLCVGFIHGVMNTDNMTISGETIDYGPCAKTDLITNVSHDLRTPLTSIIGYLNLIEEGKYKDEVELMYYVDIAYDKSLNLNILINDLFELTKMQNRTINFDKVELNLVELIGQLVSQFEIQFKQANMRCRIDFSVEKLMINADPIKLVRAFENLITNAMRYGKEGYYVDIKVFTEDEMAVVQMINYGEPIPVVDLPHIFDRFYRVEKSRNTFKGGSGLGLAITKNIIEAHDGIICATSDNESTIFEVKIPYIN